MALQTGARLGVYEIRGPLGAGGMGEVYRAWDARLGREVAVKVLPQSAATDPDRLRRFEQEARAAGALNHPNVLAVYDVGEHESTPYIVSELLEGDTLRAQIRAGGLTPRKAVEHGVQIARGLAAAHQKGIVHRDLKPENVFVTRDGHVKILDFGLAKLRGDASGRAEQETATAETQPGVLVGTVPYLSPEQVRGLPADPRSDIFALGAVLYEMLAGKRAFAGETRSETETAILREDPPDLTAVNGSVPPAVDRIVRRCLEKQPQDRFQKAEDVAFALEAVASATSPPAAATGPRRSWRAPLAILAALLVGGAAGAWLVEGLRSSPTSPSYTQLTFRRGTILSARFSQDGRTVVYSAAWDGEPAQVFTTRVGSGESRPLGVQGVVLSVSSKDEVAVKLGRFLARRAFGKEELGTLGRVSIAGGTPRQLLEDVAAAEWDPEGRDLAVLHQGRLEYPAGKVLYEPEGQIYAVRAVSQGRFLLLEDGENPPGGPYRQVLSVVDGASRRTLASPGWLPSKDLSWSSRTGEAFFAAPLGTLGVRAVTLRGRERLVARMPGTFVPHDVDSQGRLLLERRFDRTSTVALVPGESRERDLSWLDGTFAVDLSPDGRHILLQEYNRLVDTDGIYLRKTDGSPAVRLGDEYAESLSPDGRFVLALPRDQDPADHLVLVPTGAGERRELRHGSLRFSGGNAWFPDARRLAVLAGEEGRPGRRLFVWDVETGAPPRPVSDEGDMSCPVVSPDGRRVALVTGAGGLVLHPVDGGAARTLPGAAPGDQPLRWSGDGRWLYVQRERQGPWPWTRRSVWIDRIDVAAGTRQPWKQLTLPDGAGVFFMGDVSITPDGRSYAYAINSSIGTLYLAEGLR